MEKAPGICSDAITRIPMIWRWPGRFTAGHAAARDRRDRRSGQHALRAWPGLEPMETADGKDISHLLRGEAGEVHAIGVTEFAWSKSVRKGKLPPGLLPARDVRGRVPRRVRRAVRPRTRPVGDAEPLLRSRPCRHGPRAAARTDRLARHDHAAGDAARRKGVNGAERSVVIATPSIPTGRSIPIGFVCRRTGRRTTSDTGRPKNSLGLTRSRCPLRTDVTKLRTTAGYLASRPGVSQGCRRLSQLPYPAGHACRARSRPSAARWETRLARDCL